MDGITQKIEIEQKEAIEKEIIEQKEQKQRRGKQKKTPLHETEPVINPNLETMEINSVEDIINAEFAAKIRNIYWNSAFIGLYQKNNINNKMELLICKDLEAKIRILLKKQDVSKFYELIYNIIAEDVDILNHVEKTFLKYYPNRKIIGSYLDKDNPEFYVLETETEKTKKFKKFYVELYYLNGKWLVYKSKFTKQDFQEA